jgi:hypothetical protein
MLDYQEEHTGISLGKKAFGIPQSTTKTRMRNEENLLK